MLFRFYITITLIIIILSHTTLSKNVTGNINGTVTNRQTGMPVENVTILLVNIDKKVSSDSLGVFEFRDIPVGLYTITGFSEQYDTTILHNIQIKSGTNKPVFITLQRKTSIEELSKITVTSNKINQKKSFQSTSVTQVTNFELNNTAGTTNDLNMVIGTLPSAVIGISEGFDNNLYVRGGNSAENIYLVDGMELENTSHFSSLDQSGGAIGFLNPSLINNLDFYAGGIPASMPARISSVIDVNLREGSFTDRKYQIDLNMSGLGLTMEGPLFNRKMSYLINTRMVYLKFLKSFIDNIEGIPFYGDTHAKFTLKPNGIDTYNLNFLFAFDKYKYDSYWWLNRNENWYREPTEPVDLTFTYALGARWDRQFKDINARNQLLLTGVKVDHISGEDLKNGLTGLSTTQRGKKLSQHRSMAQSIDTGNFILDRWFDSERIWENSDKRDHLALKNNFSWFLRDKDQFDIGLTGKYLRYNMRNKSAEGERAMEATFQRDSVTNELIILDTLKPSYIRSFSFDRDSLEESYEISGYGQYIFEQNIFKMIAGLRGDYYRMFRDYAFSPRLAFSWNLGNAGIFSLSSGMYYQPHAELNSILFSFLVPNPNGNRRSLKLYELELQRNMQIVLGYEKYLPLAHYLSAEIYYKHYDREYAFITPEDRDYIDNTFFDPNWFHLNKPEGEKRVYGVELLFQKKQYKSLYYSFAYSMFFAENKYTNGKYYLDENAMGNTFSSIIGFNFFKYHGVALRFSAMQGKPHCDYILVGEENRKTAVLDPTKDFYSSRFDPMFSFNLRYSFNVSWPKANLSFYLECLNLLNLTPTVDRYFRYGRQEFIEDKVNGFVPIGGITIDF